MPTGPPPSSPVQAASSAFWLPPETCRGRKKKPAKAEHKTRRSRQRLPIESLRRLRKSLVRLHTASLERPLLKKKKKGLPNPCCAGLVAGLQHILFLAAASTTSRNHRLRCFFCSAKHYIPDLVGFINPEKSLKKLPVLNSSQLRARSAAQHFQCCFQHQEGPAGRTVVRLRVEALGFVVAPLPALEPIARRAPCLPWLCRDTEGGRPALLVV